MPRRCERIDHGHAAPSEAVLQIFREKQPATSLRRCGENDGIPDAELVIRHEINRRQHHLRRGFDRWKRVAPDQKGAGLGS